MIKKGLQLRYSLFLMVFGVLFLSASTVQAQTDRTGSYKYQVKEGETFKLYVYTENGETYGRLRVEGSETYELNLWSLKTDDYIDFYYEIDINNPLFTQDTHILTLSGDQKKPLSVFGKELKIKVDGLKPADMMAWESKGPTFEIKEKSKSQTLEVKSEKKN